MRHVAMLLGAGKKKKEDDIDHSAGCSSQLKSSNETKSREVRVPPCIIFYNNHGNVYGLKLLLKMLLRQLLTLY